ncbi:MAG: exosortase [Bryobacteraceae bacterium]|nr:exosortase [Bryobacteraceae bacterium]
MKLTPLQKYLVWFSLLIAICYFPVIGNITWQWVSNDDMSHGFFVPLIVGYIVWERRSELFSVDIKRSGWGLAFLIVGGILACLGALAAEIFTQRVALMVTIGGLVWYLGGGALLRRLAFPLTLLCFMLPLPGLLYKQITFPLQILASRIAEQGLELLGHIVLREGNIIEMAGWQISVIEACSGVRALLSLAFFSLAYAYLFHPQVWMRWALLAAAFPIAVLANSSRIVLTGILGEYDPRLAEGFFHGMSGWAVFVIAILMLALTERVLRRFGSREASS